MFVNFLVFPPRIIIKQKRGNYVSPDCSKISWQNPKIQIDRQLFHTYTVRRKHIVLFLCFRLKIFQFFWNSNETLRFLHNFSQKIVWIADTFVISIYKTICL